jgi:hypothetical protein
VVLLAGLSTLGNKALRKIHAMNSNHTAIPSHPSSDELAKNVKEFVQDIRIIIDKIEEFKLSLPQSWRHQIHSGFEI